MRGSATRAWLVAHEAGPVVGGMVVLTAVLGLGASWLIPIPGQVVPLPVWQLTPAAYAMLAAVGVSNGLPVVRRSRRVWTARGLWLSLVVSVTMLGAAIVDRVAGLPSLVPPTGSLVVLTFGASALVGRAAVWVGGACIAWILFHVQEYASTATPWELGGGARTVLLPVLLVNWVLGFVIR